MAVRCTYHRSMYRHSWNQLYPSERRLHGVAHPLRETDFRRGDGDASSKPLDALINGEETDPASASATRVSVTETLGEIYQIAVAGGIGLAFKIFGRTPFNRSDQVDLHSDLSSSRRSESTISVRGTRSR
jgi:hypothetical protein